MEHNLQIVATIFAEHMGLKISTVANYSANDGKLFQRFKEGGSCTLKTADRVMTWLSDNWPEDLSWPADIPRPDPSSEEAA